EKRELYAMLRNVLGSIAVLSSPLSALSLSRLLNTPIEDIDQTLEDLYAILYIPKDHTRPLGLHHPSFRDFLLNNERCSDPNFLVDKKQAHRTLFNRCTQLMHTCLKRDICGVGAAGVFVTDISNSLVEQCIPPELQYACLYWVEHLRQGDVQLHDDEQVHQFLQKHFLHWLEALSLMRKTSESILAINLLESTVIVRNFFLG
ncbi:uncharacterized protein BDR25DRAFT_373473, partial [Lindgomyces ingoldianus]